MSFPQTGLIESDFTLRTGSGSLDFSASGAPITFGLETRNSGGEGITVGYDNYSDGQDFIIWNSNKFTTTGKWSEGDWNADGSTNGQDFILWNTNKFQSPNDTGTASIEVPFEVGFGASVVADNIISTARTKWLGQREVFLKTEILGVNGGCEDHSSQAVAVADTSDYNGDELMALVIVDWSTDTVPRPSNEAYTTCIQMLGRIERRTLSSRLRKRSARTLIRFENESL